MNLFSWMRKRSEREKEHLVRRIIEEDLASMKRCPSCGQMYHYVHQCPNQMELLPLVPYEMAISSSAVTMLSNSCTMPPNVPRVYDAGYSVRPIRNVEWACEHCGHVNIIAEHLECRMCGAPRKVMR